MSAGPAGPGPVQPRTGGYLPIAGYGLVGDCRSAALCGVDGSIDWCCLPRFDSPSVFARILDPDRGGCWQVAPAVPHRSLQRYAEKTNVLQTIFVTGRGRAEVTDFMPATTTTSPARSRSPARSPVSRSGRETRSRSG